jgi:hypothetical protein
MKKFEKLIIVAVIMFLVIVIKVGLSKDGYQGELPDPVQVDLDAPKSVYVTNMEKEVEVDFLAEYTIEAVIKSKKKYSDYASDISRYDVALAWGDLNSKEIDDYVKYSQRGRWYYYNMDNDCPVSVSYIGERSANVHLIHENNDILKDIRALDEGDHIKLKGYLVKVNFESGPWTSSLTRTDTGDGACEVMYVTSVEVIK